MACSQMIQPFQRLGFRKERSAIVIVKAKFTGELHCNPKVVEELLKWRAAQCIVDQDKEHFWTIGLELNVK